MADLTISNLTIEYSSGGYGVRPIDRLDLTAKAGSLVILLGPSGCGKTSLLSCLGSILKPTSGSVSFGDIEVTALAGRDLTEYRQRTVGIVFQAFNLVASMTALENVALPLRCAGLKAGPARERATALLQQMGLGARLHHRPGDLSGGQQQRVAVCRALALDPPLVLADEPTAHLDYVQVEEVLRVLRELAGGERVVVVATHDHRLLPLADQVVELVPDRVFSTRPPERVHLLPGEVLFRQGSWGDLIYVVQSGDMAIIAERADGTEECRAVVGPGQYFGEMGPLFSIPRSATARAVGVAEVVGYTVRDFREQKRNDGSFDFAVQDFADAAE
jgi:putative ABC transport system ATP-binding protein